MASTQFSCPHCGSTLNFGTEIAEGAVVECLICMRSFAVTNRILVPSPAAPVKLQEPEISTVPEALVVEEVPVQAVAPSPSVIKPKPTPTGAKRWPSDEVLIAKPYITPTARETTEERMVSSSPGHDAESAGRTSALIIAVTIGLLFLLAGGLTFAAWKITLLGRSGSSSDSPMAKVGADPANDPAKAVKKKASSAAAGDDDPDLRSTIQEEVKQVLKRTNAPKPGEESNQDTVPINFTKQNIVGLDQQKINLAIEKGVAYLKSAQRANGSWSSDHQVGYAAIGGLTLLECDVPAKDPAVQKAAGYIRKNTAKLSATYQLSLAILFLDRLGEPRDRTLIQGMALRLLAGQHDDGGWTYQCPALNPKEMYQLYTFLRSHKQPNLVNPVGGNPKTQSGIATNPAREPGKLNDPFQDLSDLLLAKGIEGKSSDPKRPGVIQPAHIDPNPPGVTLPISVDPVRLPGAKPSTDKSAPKPIRPETLVPSLRSLPIVKNQGTKKGETKLRNGGSDNSNTQFAMLALWAARRHDVATDQALLASYQRFLNPQNPDGGWGYQPGTQSTNSMTNVGLLGLALGHGAFPDIVQFNPKDPRDAVVKPALQDPNIQKGLQALAKYIGTPSRDPEQTSFPMKNLYFLWSVERVAMLYDLKTIGGKDWYGWGAQILVHNQELGGEWPTEFYHGNTLPLNTCFALLFLRRSNLVQDLTDNLRLYTGIRDSDK